MVEIKDAKIAHFGNPVNDAFLIVKALRDHQINADLIVYRPAHVCSLPQWELCDLDVNDIGDPYDPNWQVLNKDFNQPVWMHVLNFSQRLISKPQRFWQVIRAMREYDFIIAHAPFPIYAQFSNRPYVSFDAGAIRYFDANNIRTKLFKRGYSKAKDIIVTNPDTMDLFDRYGFKYHFVPFLIDTSRYRYEKPEKEFPYEYVFFMPSRQYWKEKGNNIFVESFYKFHNEQKDSVLVMTEWGTDLRKTKELVKKLEIEKSVIWLPLMSKPRLIKWYNLSTAIADQFILGSYGTTAPEAMACEKPVIMYLSEQHNMKAFGDLPPVLNVKKKEDILNYLLLCTDSNFTRRIGEQSRKWIEKIHGPEVVINKHLAIYKNIIEK
ncbi:MAG: glycosyltransferase [Candidatus Bathyarchaeia archaeon]